MKLISLMPDAAGQSILRLLHKAAGVAEANSRHALEMAQKLSHQLRAAEDRIADLEDEIAHYREKAERAEHWLHNISMEIEESLIRQPEEKLQRNVPSIVARSITSLNNERRHQNLR
jgi:hypothetical protein